MYQLINDLETIFMPRSNVNCKSYMRLFPYEKILSEVGFEPTPPIGDQNTRTLKQRKLCLSLAP